MDTHVYGKIPHKIYICLGSKIPQKKKREQKESEQEKNKKNELKLQRAERDESRVESLMLEDKLKACQRSKRSLIEQLSKTEENMLIIIDQYKEKLNLVASHVARSRIQYLSRPILQCLNL